MSQKLAKGLRAISLVLSGAGLGTLGAGLYGILFISLVHLTGASGRATSIRLSWIIISGAIAGTIAGITRALDRACDYPVELVPFEERGSKVSTAPSRRRIRKKVVRIKEKNAQE